MSSSTSMLETSRPRLPPTTTSSFSPLLEHCTNTKTYALLVSILLQRHDNISNVFTLFIKWIISISTAHYWYILPTYYITCCTIHSYISFLLYTLCMTPVSTKRFGAARRIPLMTGTPTASCSKLMLAGYTAAREQLLRVPWLRRVNTPESPFTRMLQATAVHGNLVLLYYRTLSLQLELI